MKAVSIWKPKQINRNFERKLKWYWRRGKARAVPVPGLVRLGYTKGQTLLLAAQFAIMPHIQFHFNCNNFGPSQKERYKINTRMANVYICRYMDKYWKYTYIYICVWLNFCFMCGFLCCLFFSCKMHFTFYCALNQKSISVCRLCERPTLPTSHSPTQTETQPQTRTLTRTRSPGTVLVYSKNMPARVSTGGWMSE